MTRSLFLIATFILASALPALARPPEKTAIIKADDLRGITANWNRFIAASTEKNVKVSIGIIAISLQDHNSEYVAWINKHQTSGLVEFWNHGLTHKRWVEGDNKQISEFSSSGYEFQKTHFDDAQNLMRKTLGIAPIAFGAPFNATDRDTLKIINENPDSKLFFCNRVDPELTKTSAPMNLRGEHDGTGKPNFEKFKEEYLKEPDVSFSAIQFHPNNFTDKQFSEYCRILDFLIAEGWTFVLPTEYLLQAERG